MSQKDSSHSYRHKMSAAMAVTTSSESRSLEEAERRYYGSSADGVPVSRGTAELGISATFSVRAATWFRLTNFS
jgi:hypothetical protein